MPFRVAIPNNAMNPTLEATLSTPPVKNTPTTPPIRANGRLDIMINV